MAYVTSVGLLALAIVSTNVESGLRYVRCRSCSDRRSWVIEKSLVSGGSSPYGKQISNKPSSSWTSPALGGCTHKSLDAGVTSTGGGVLALAGGGGGSGGVDGALNEGEPLKPLGTRFEKNPVAARLSGDGTLSS
ncbi:hypothetical protein PR003_g863 [Phytophthora rubi]|uniref:Secreted protein n=1 Tax=Phytophthora rubi TaxID=129364 RepID=A0A6A4G4N7_9STRA|nr:hypothetical protein PF003_g28264 [Phytophthora fragariae]KAE9359199.1 hypothetical protein PR003_g863 [Phytophthora rubi]